VWFDSHCHLHLCEVQGPVAEVVSRARAAGVLEVLTVGIDLESSRREIDIARAHGLWAAAGVHPNLSTGWDERLRAELELVLGGDRVVAVGETGLDFFRNNAPRDDQERAFVAHIELATEMDLALVIHTRDSAARALTLLEEHGAPDRVVFHCWSASEHELDRALTLGAFVSFAGNVSFPRARELAAAAAMVPEDRLLVETDSPFLTPVPRRGRPNEPSCAPLVGAALAKVRAADVEQLATTTAANARTLLKLDGP
jgi:TatD DNase family protein